ncbi:MAG: hypothetical protein PVI80_09550, partial [Anaerolineae bacterium]
RRPLTNGWWQCLSGRWIHPEVILRRFVWKREGLWIVLVDVRLCPLASFVHGVQALADKAWKLSLDNF